MKKIKSCYNLSKKTDDDIGDIFDYTEEKYGFNQAIKYVNEFVPFFNHLLINPTIGKHRIEIKNNLYSLAKDEHIIFYKILKDKIRIVRILHGSKDLPKYF